MRGTHGLTCCGEGGAWDGQCGIIGEANVMYTWQEGYQSCGTTCDSGPCTEQIATTTEPTTLTPSRGQFLAQNDEVEFGQMNCEIMLILQVALMIYQRNKSLSYLITLLF